MRGFVFVLLLATLLPISTAAAVEDRFSLDQISSDFPSEGFETEIEFWRLVFVEYGDRDIVFHDETDLRLVYRVVTFDRGVRNNPEEFKRQRKALRTAKKELERRFVEISRWGRNSDRLTAAHRNLVKVLETHGVEVSSKRLRSLSRGVHYQRGIKEKFLEGLIRSGRYMDRIVAIFQSRGLPVELAMMPHVESSFDYSVYSKVGAAGMWQFMRSTGRQYMTINRYIDERRDPIAATDAASRYLRDNYERLGTWPLAITAFNHGANGMRRAQKKHGSDFRTIVDKYRSRTFGFASKNFYPEFLAAVDVAYNYKDYFGEVEFESPDRFDIVPLKRGYHVAHFSKIEGLDDETLRSYNPQLTRYVWKNSKVVPAGVQLRVPPGMGGAVRAALSRFKPAPDRVTVAENGALLYEVRPGDTLGWMARNFGTSVGTIQRLNGIRNANRIRVGQKLVVSTPPKDGANRYRVRRGDSLSIIAKRFGTTVLQIQSMNGIQDSDRIFPGQVLVIAVSQE